ncbi:transposase [Specibacter cremeus]|uniref:IS701 family transposase n=1 Tax=Specibacter cremeus TaxID=1629051 RepID=UPI0013DE646F|nr:transposase [Specibacter cremeus]
MVAVPPSLLELLGRFRGCFTAPTFVTFCALVTGLVAQTGKSTVCGMWVGARLAGLCPHHRAHRFFSHARWSVQALSQTLTGLVVALLVPAGAPVPVAVDDTLFHRRGPTVHAASWFHDGSAVGVRKVGYGNNWVIAAIVVSLPFVDRPIALPTGFALVCKGGDSRLVHARRLIEQIAAAVPDRRLDVVADCAYAGQALRGLQERITWTTRLKATAALYQPAPPRTGKRGRPRLKGEKLPHLAELADTLSFTPTGVHRYGTDTTVHAAVLRCLWYGVFGTQPVQVVVVRDTRHTGYDIVLVSTDLHASPGRLIERYASRWSVEIAIEDAKQTVGVGQARNRLPAAVHRTVPIGLATETLAICWYATTGHHPDDVAATRQLAPWYTSKSQPSVPDMLTKLRRVIIATQFRPRHPQRPGPRKGRRVGL